jgi:TPR repeat protein
MAEMTAAGLRGIGPLAVVLVLSGGCTADMQPVRLSPAAQPVPAARPTAAACGSPTLGIETVDASRALRRQHGLPEDGHGALIVEVLPDGPAALAGIAAWDVIERVETDEGKEVNASADFAAAMEAVTCGDTVEVTIRRGDEQLTRSVSPISAIPFYTDACRKGLATGCFRQGWLTAGGAGVEKDAERAEELYDQACRLESGAACRELARLWSAPERAADRVRLLERSCALHFATGCVDLAFDYATGHDGVARDDARATPIFVEACDGGEASGCYNAGLMYDDGRGVPEDPAAAAAAYEDGCRGGSAMACDNLGTHYVDGRGVERSSEKAADLYRRACDGSSWDPSNDDGCVNLGRAYRDGIGVEKNPVRAAELFAQVCVRTAEDADRATEPAGSRACSLLGAQFASGSGVEADLSSAIELSKKGCDRGDAFGCFNLGAMYENGQGVTRDDTAARGYYQRACDLDDAEACFQFGLMSSEGRGGDRSDEQAAAFYERACNAGDGKGCVNLGGLYADGDGVPLDVPKGLALFARGCDAGEPVGCFNLANHYTDGTGVPADPARAAALYQQACSGGYEAACAKVENRQQ